ncbi:conserved fungal protein [Savitreella phatthalungensis]
MLILLPFANAVIAQTVGSSASASATTTTAFTSSVIAVPGPGPSTQTSNTTASANPPSDVFGDPLVYTYTANGSLTVPEPKPYTPAGGFGNNGSAPVYHPLTDFDFQSLSVALYQEWAEEALFAWGLEQYPLSDWQAIGLGQGDIDVLKFFKDQEQGHAALITNMLGASAPGPCSYNWPQTDLRGYLDFCERLTSWGEAGVGGFIARLDSRATAQLLFESIVTESRQTMWFRQASGLPPIAEYFRPGISQSSAWTQLAPYITSCPPQNLGTRKLAWRNFPALRTTNGPSIVSPDNTTEIFNGSLSVTYNRTISEAGRNVTFSFDAPGLSVGPNGQYLTSASVTTPAFIAWTSHLNTTYTPFYQTSNSTGWTIQPNYTILPSYFQNGTLAQGARSLSNSVVIATQPQVAGTMFVTLVDAIAPTLGLTSFNASMLDLHTVAGPVTYIAS